jgi:hypothetical protein
MATERQKAAARRNLKKVRAVRATGRSGREAPRESRGITTREEGRRLSDKAFAFPKQRNEPLVDARHVRNAIARFYQVEGVNDVEREAAWRRIRSAARRYGVEVPESSWYALKTWCEKGSVRRPIEEAETLRRSIALHRPVRHLGGTLTTL